MSQLEPLVCVIVATYNWSSVLRYALASVKNQTIADFEVFVIGDGCTDDSAAVVESLHDPRFHWKNLPQNSGHQSAPNNAGLALARGEWIAYLGHDDLWMPNHLEVLLRAAQAKRSDVVFSLAMVIGAPGCGGRRVFGAFAQDEYVRGAHLPPSALLHRRRLTKQPNPWPDYQSTSGSPETELLTRFYDDGARFTGVREVTVFKFPSSWRPMSYVHRSCAEQAAFFERMQREPDFLLRELTDATVAQELLLPHTTVAPPSQDDELQPGATIARFRQNRGLSAKIPEVGAAQFIPNRRMLQLIRELSREEMRRKQASRFTHFEIFYAHKGQYGGAGAHTRVLVPLGRWRRLRIRLEAASEGAPLRIDPCDEPALVEIAWLALRSDEGVVWSLRGEALARLRLAGDAVRLSSGRALRLQSVGDDPIIILPEGTETHPQLCLDCWIRINRDDPPG